MLLLLVTTILPIICQQFNSRNTKTFTFERGTVQTRKIRTTRFEGVIINRQLNIGGKIFIPISYLEKPYSHNPIK